MLSCIMIDWWCTLVIHVFEDNSDDRLVKLFNKSYKEEVQNKFIYAASNAFIQGVLDDIKEPKKQEVVVYLDVSPDNKNTVKIYERLTTDKVLEEGKEPNIKRFKRFIVLPIPCREFYYIKALHNTQVEIRKDWVNDVLSRKPFWNQTLLSIPKEKELCKNFEKFCKRVAYNSFKYCTIKKNNLGYFDISCICNDNSDKMFDTDCRDEDIDLKVFRILAAFPCFPSGSNFQSKYQKYLNQLNWEDIEDIHRKLVNDYNEQVKAFKDAQEGSRKSYYREIKPMY